MKYFILSFGLAVTFLACSAHEQSSDDSQIVSALTGEEESYFGDGLPPGENENGVRFERPLLGRNCDAAAILEEKENSHHGRRGRHGGGGRHPGSKGKGMWLVSVYDFDQSGELDDEEKEALLSDFTARCEALHAELLEKYDENANGVLDEEEIAKIREEIDAKREERRAEMLAEFDVNGDGELDEEERHAAHEARRSKAKECREMFVDSFDIDGDGVLQEEEIDAIREEIRSGTKILSPCLGD